MKGLNLCLLPFVSLHYGNCSPGGLMKSLLFNSGDSGSNLGWKIPGKWHPLQYSS